MNIDNQPIGIRQQKRRILRNITHIQHHPRHVPARLCRPDLLQISIIRNVEAFTHKLRPQPGPMQVKVDPIRIWYPRGLKRHLGSQINRNPRVSRCRPMSNPRHQSQRPAFGRNNPHLRHKLVIGHSFVVIPQRIFIVISWHILVVIPWRSGGIRFFSSTHYESVFHRRLTQLRQLRPSLPRRATARSFLHNCRILLPRNRPVLQILFLDRRFGQQRRYPQPAAWILRPQKFVLPHRRSQALRIAQRPPLFRQQFRHRIHCFRRMRSPRIAVINRTKTIHHLRKRSLGLTALGQRFKLHTLSLCLLKRRQLVWLSRRLGPR